MIKTTHWLNNLCSGHEFDLNPNILIPYLVIINRDPKKRFYFLVILTNCIKLWHSNIILCSFYFIIIFIFICFKYHTIIFYSLLNLIFLYRHFNLLLFKLCLKSKIKKVKFNKIIRCKYIYKLFIISNSINLKYLIFKNRNNLLFITKVIKNIFDYIYI